MSITTFESMHRLTDQELLARLKQLAGFERQATAALVAHLAEMDVRRLYLGQGFSSLYSYCIQVLHLSEHAAYGRIEAARAARRFPVILEMLERGEVNLTTVGLLARHLEPEKHRELLEAARFRSKRDVEEILARVSPRPAVPASIRKLPSPRPAARSLPGSGSSDSRPRDGVPEPVGCGDAGGSARRSDEIGPEPGRASAAQVSAADAHASATRGAGGEPPSRRAMVVPISPERYRIQFTATAETCAKLRRAQDLLRHQIPNGDPAAVFDRALSVLVRELERREFAAMERPRPQAVRRAGSRARSRFIPSAVRRAVWERDGGRCAFVGEAGHRCEERGRLEFHHVDPHGVGGPPSIENIELRCRAHNVYEADLYYGTHGASDVRESPAEYGERMRSEDSSVEPVPKPSARFGKGLVSGNSPRGASSVLGPARSVSFMRMETGSMRCQGRAAGDCERDEHGAGHSEASSQDGAARRQGRRTSRRDSARSDRGKSRPTGLRLLPWGKVGSSVVAAVRRRHRFLENPGEIV